MNIIERVRKLVEEGCKKDSNIFGYSIWTDHIIPMVNFAKILAKKVNADLEIVEIATLLHDYAAIEGHDPNTHHISGVEEAERILKEFNYPQAKIEKIKHCVYAHRASQSIKRETKEAECVANADAMSHFNNIPSLFYLAFVMHRMSVEKGIKWLRNKLERSWNKLTPEAREIIKDKYDASMIILKSAKQRC